MLESYPFGNVEAGVLRYEHDTDYYDYILNNPTLSLADIPFSEILPAKYETSLNIPEPSLILTEAYIEEDNLHLGFSTSHPEIELDGSLEIHSALGGDPLKRNCQLESGRSSVDSRQRSFKVL